MTLSIVGGVPPYALSIDWGDGTTDLISQPVTGDHHYAHTYISPNSYVVVVKATDRQGQAAYYQTLILAAGPSLPSNSRGEIGSQLLIAWPLFAVMLVMLLSFWLGEKFDAARLHHKA